LLDADGSRVISDGPLFEHPQFSSDGESIAVSVVEEGTAPAIWIYGANSKVKRKIADNARFPLWDPDDQRLTFMKVGKGLVRQSLRSPQDQELIVPHEQFIVPDAWIGQNSTLLYHGVYPNRGVFAYTREADKEPNLRLSRGAAFPSLPTDESLVVFCTWPHGIKIGSFAELSSSSTLSDSGCTPHWGNDDTRIYYQSFNKLWAVSVQEKNEQGPIIGEAELVADLGYPGISLFDVDQSGRIVLARHEDTAPKPPVLVINWESALK